MTASKDTTASYEHAEVMDLLPWYANGTLSLIEKQQVDAHLSSCIDCMNHLKQFEDIDQLFGTEPNHAWEPSEAHFEKLMAFIDTNAPMAPTAITVKKRAKRTRTAWREWLESIPAAIRWTLALETFAVAGLATVLLLPRTAVITPETGLFQTYSREPNQTTPGAGHRLHVVFAPTTQLSELGSIAKALQAQIVSGPTPLGVYVLEIPESQQIDIALKQLRGNPRVTLAEPIPER